MHAFCGMSYAIGDDRLSRHQARSIVARRLRSYRQRGYTVSILQSGAEYEAIEPATAVMVPDDAGVLTIADHLVPAYECRECGNVLPIGDACSCTDPIDDDDTEGE